MDEQSDKKYQERNPLYLKEWRKYRKLTQGEICELLKVEQPTLSRWEKRINPVNIDTLEQLAAIYKVEVSDLLLRNPFEPDPVDAVYLELKKAPERVQRQAANLLKALLHSDEEGE